MVYTKTVVKHKGAEKFKIGCREKTNHTNTNYKKVCVAMLLAIKVDFKAKSITKDNKNQQW